MQINIKKLKRELHYHPAWEEDRYIFMKLLQQSEFSDQDIVMFGRLHVKYSHIHLFQKSELANYFSYMLKKMQIRNIKELFSKTNDIYQQSTHLK